MSFEDALRILRADAMPGLRDIYGGVVDVINDGVEEYEWGWVVFIGAVVPAECIPEYANVVSALIVDRETGHFIDASTATLRFEIERFLRVLGRNIQCKDLIPLGKRKD